MDTFSELLQALSDYRIAREQSPQTDDASRAKLLRDRVREIAQAKFLQDHHQRGQDPRHKPRRIPE